MTIRSTIGWVCFPFRSMTYVIAGQARQPLSGLFHPLLAPHRGESKNMGWLGACGFRPDPLQTLAVTGFQPDRPLTDWPTDRPLTGSFHEPSRSHATDPKGLGGLRFPARPSAHPSNPQGNPTFRCPFLRKPQGDLTSHQAVWCNGKRRNRLTPVLSDQ